MSDLTRALLDELARDPEAIERLRALVAPTAARPSAPAYTVAQLAAETGLSPKAVRGAIARGELEAVKRGTRWIVSADAVAAWATAPPSKSRMTGGARRRTANRDRVMARALGADAGQGVSPRHPEPPRPPFRKTAVKPGP